MAESLAAAQGISINVSLPVGGDISINIDSISATSVKYLCETGLKLDAMYTAYKFIAKAIDGAISRTLGGERDDQRIGGIRPGSLHVLLHCLTDQRLLEVLEDFECGTMKERLEKEFLKIGIKVEGLKVQIDNIEEVKKRKEQM